VQSKFSFLKLDEQMAIIIKLMAPESIKKL